MAHDPQCLSEVDALFFSAETPAQHLHVLATLVLDRSSGPGGDYELFQSRVAERFHLIEPLRRRPLPGPLGGTLWIDDPDIHLQRHLHHVVLAEGGGLEALADTASDIASYPLPRDRPLWEAWCVEGFEKGQMAVIAKVHHSAVDGVSGIFALSAFFDLEPFPETSHSARWQQPTPANPAALLKARIDGARSRPASVLKSATRLAKSGVQLVRSNNECTPLPCTGPRMSYNRSLSPRRSVAFTTLKVDDVKRISKGFDVSVNDVVVALCAGVLRRHAIQCDELPDRPLVAAIPVSERRPEHGSAGNQMSFMFYALPVHLADPRQRIDFVSRSAAQAKDLHSRAGQGLLAAVAALAPKFAMGPAMRAMSSIRAADVLPPMINVLISNIRGPELPLYVAGASLKSIFPMGPVIEGVGLGITAVSYQDEFAFGFIACSDLVNDIRDFSLGLHLEMATMLDCLPTELH